MEPASGDLVARRLYAALDGRDTSALAGVLGCGAFLSISNYPYLWYLPAMIVALERAAARLASEPTGPASEG